MESPLKFSDDGHDEKELNARKSGDGPWKWGPLKKPPTAVLHQRGFFMRGGAKEVVTAHSNKIKRVRINSRNRKERKKKNN